MPSYIYTATTQEGKSLTGELVAKDKYALASALRAEGFVLTSAKEKREAASFLRKIMNIELGGVSVKDKLFLIRNLKVLVSAGVSLPKALAILSEQASSKKLKRTLLEMREEVVRGETLSSAMGRHKDAFPEIFQSMVKVGEESGTLENVLSHLALQLEREHELRSKIQGALLYPAVVVSAMSLVGVLMLVVVVPELAKTFDDLGTDLPVTTRFVIGLGEFLKNFWYVAAGLVAAFLVALPKATKIPEVKRALDSFFLQAPLVSGIVHKTNSALIVRTLSSLIAAGVPLLRALEITATTTKSARFQHSLEASAELVRKGAKLSEALAGYRDLYPVIVIQMTQVGEETGQTAEILAKLADFFEEEVTNATRNLASVIEPLLMLVVGGVVGFFAISMIQPMYSMLNAIE